MLKPPSLKNVLSYPVTTSTAIAAIVVTLQWWSGQSIDLLVTNGRVWEKWELWRALTAVFPHVSVFHLAFNLYWLWTFGTLVERIFGPVRCAGIFLLLAFGSSLAEFAILAGGVGLSGVGYGLWGMLWALEQRDPRFAGAVDRQTSQMFVGWFFLCIALTMANIMPVGNIAHGVGAGMGVLLGFCISGRAAVKWKCGVGLVLLLVLELAASLIFWPRINLSEYSEYYVERAGVTRLEHDDNQGALKFLETAVKMRHAPGRAWYNLGVAYYGLGRYQDALTAFERAAQMPGVDSDMQKAMQDCRDYLNGRKSNP